MRRRQNNTKTDDVRNDYRISHISAKEIKDLFLTTKIFCRKILITIWSCTHHTHLFRPTCLIINTCDQNWREMQNFHLRMQRLLLDCCELVDRCGWFFGRRGSLWVVVDRCGLLWGRSGSLWGHSGSLWIVVGRCGVIVGRCGS